MEVFNNFFNFLKPSLSCCESHRGSTLPLPPSLHLPTETHYRGFHLNGKNKIFLSFRHGKEKNLCTSGRNPISIGIFKFVPFYRDLNLFQLYLAIRFAQTYFCEYIYQSILNLDISLTLFEDNFLL